MNRRKSGPNAPVLHLLALMGLLLFAAFPAAAQQCPLPAAVLEDFPLDGAMAHVRYLADDDLRGRAVATAGERCASFYISERLREAGLEPAGLGGSYFHTFPVRSGTELGPENALTVADTPLAPLAEWTPLAASASGSVSAPLVYAGFGLSRPGSPDRSSSADVSGRIAVVEWGDPDSPDGRSLRADPAFKARVAEGRGAAGLLVLLPSGMDAPDLRDQTTDMVGIPVASVSSAIADDVRRAAEAGRDGSIITDVRPTFREARNVVAILPGSDRDTKPEYVVVGAHYDHLGATDTGGTPRVFNGADDNASGTAALLEIAWRLRSAEPERSVVFIAFTGEEEGLWGSARFVDYPTIPLDRVLAMINLDMVGRLEDGMLQVHGTGTASEWDELLVDANRGLPRALRLQAVPAATGPSDHATFHAAGIPALHLFTGTHEDYHRTTDDWERVDPDGLDQVIALATELIRALASPSVVPALTSPSGG